MGDWEKTMLVQNMVQDIVTPNALMMLNSLMGRPTLLIGNPTLKMRMATWGPESMEHAAPRWIFGKPTRWLPPTHPILVILKDYTNVMALNAAIMTRASVTKVYVTKTDVICNLTEWKMKTSTVQVHSLQ